MLCKQSLLSTTLLVIGTFETPSKWVDLQRSKGRPRMIRGSVRYLWAVAAIATTACSADVQDSSLEKAQEPLVRATADGGKDQVVLLYAQTVVNGQVRSRSCSATLIAPRVLLTAAHCLKDAW